MQHFESQVEEAAAVSDRTKIIPLLGSWLDLVVSHLLSVQHFWYQSSVFLHTSARAF